MDLLSCCCEVVVIEVVVSIDDYAKDGGPGAV